MYKNAYATITLAERKVVVRTGVGDERESTDTTHDYAGSFVTRPLACGYALRLLLTIHRTAVRLGTLQLGLFIIDKETGAPLRSSKESSRSRLDPFQNDSSSGSMNTHEQKDSETFIGNARA